FPKTQKRAPVTDANPSTPPKCTAASTRAQRVLASLIGGAGLDEIGAAEKLTRKRTKKILRDELRRRWVAPSQEFPRLQVARLERMILNLIDRVQQGRPRSDRPRARDCRPARPLSRLHSRQPHSRAIRRRGAHEAYAKD